MKHVKYLPFLIGAASYLPKVHAAEAIANTEPSSLNLLLICLSLVVLFPGRRQTAIKIEE